MNKENKTCPKCGTNNDPKYQYCSNCGANLNGNNQNIPPRYDNNTNLFIQRIANDIHFIKTVVLVYVILSVVAAIILLTNIK